MIRFLFFVAGGCFAAWFLWDLVVAIMPGFDALVLNFNRRLL